jgi:uncharacterized protein YyaL (SSP411 family)
MPAFTNKLVAESSPYLLQHAHNPVNWYPWGDEALNIAKDQDKPILVSIGYSACHWCHVMEHESFEDIETAKLMNEHFINIKVDREERPDLDHIYMDAVQAIAGNGGWPLNVFLTPGMKPFYGGTYFPPQRAYNRASWKETLLGVSQLFKEKREEVEAQAEELTQHIGRFTMPSKKMDPLIPESEMFSRKQGDDIYINIMKQADKKWGGFGNAPKFPQTFVINYLLRYNYNSNDKDALQHASLSLDKMLQGGIYDQVGGGFARYSTDVEWLAPHFEKMLYDNALLIRSLCDAFQLTKNKEYKRTIEHTIDFIVREMTAPGGVFYSALDADSEGEEGKFYVWSYEEVKNILGDEAGIFSEYYDVSEEGNWEHKNILRVLTPLQDFAKQRGLDEAALEKQFHHNREKLLKARNKRIRPGTDDKILLGWNALMITALCKAAAALGNSGYKKMAEENFDFLFSRFRANENGHEFYHTFKDGNIKYPAFLDDYAYLIEACIMLQEITSNQDYLRHAEKLCSYVIENFISDDDGLFYYTHKKQEDVILRKKEIYDGAVPSGNSVMVYNLFYLSVIFDNASWKEKAVMLLNNISELITKYPTSFAYWASVLIDVYAGFNELAICGDEFENLRDELLGLYLPGKILQCSNKTGDEIFPLLKQKAMQGKPHIYLCRNYSCLSPEYDIPSIVNQIVKNRFFK